MNNLFKEHRKFSILVIAFIVLSIGFRIFGFKNVEDIKKNKEIVHVVFREDELSGGIKELVNNFNQNHKKIYIDLELYNKDYDNVAINKMANETKVDILNYMGKTQLEKQFIRGLDTIGIDYSFINDGSLLKFNDDVIGVKYGSAMPKLIYNDDILIKAGLNPEAKPKDLDELIVMAEKIKENVPGVKPLTISIASIHDLFALLGGPASSANSIYPTFWNYKSGGYDYSSLSNVIEKYKIMIDNGLINIDFDTKTSEGVIVDFVNEDTAIIPTTYFQKFSIMNRTSNINSSFSDIPYLNENPENRYYYTYNRVLVIAKNANREVDGSVDEFKDTSKHDEAVREVYQWLISPECTDYLIENDYNFATFSESSNKNNKFNELNNNEGYVHSVYDPTEVIVGNSDIVRKNVYDLLKGNIGIDEGIKKLTQENNDFVNNHERNQSLDRDAYKEREDE